ncbi:MAG: DUF99 family protein [Gammaproteobacteria bacterium]|nr:DUF99 family protein [Gammaproteobacteria bacterium]
MASKLSYVIGIDDAPFDRAFRGDIAVIGTVFNGPRLEGVLRSKVRRDGANATTNLAKMITGCRFADSLQAVLLQGVTFGGFNVVDLPRLSEAVGLPVVAVSRKQPDLARIRRALLDSVPGGKRKWRLIEQLEPARRHGSVYLHHIGVDWRAATALVDRFAINSHLPEPLRTAHLIAGALVAGESRHRP